MLNWSNEIPVCVWYQCIKTVLTDQKCWWSSIDLQERCQGLDRTGALTFVLRYTCHHAKPKLKNVPHFWHKRVTFLIGQRPLIRYKPYKLVKTLVSNSFYESGYSFQVQIQMLIEIPFTIVEYLLRIDIEHNICATLQRGRLGAP